MDDGMAWVGGWVKWVRERWRGGRWVALHGRPRLVGGLCTPRCELEEGERVVVDGGGGGLKKKGMRSGQASRWE